LAYATIIDEKHVDQATTHSDGWETLTFLLSRE